MYRLLDLVGESGSNGYGKSHFVGSRTSWIVEAHVVNYS
jgi:hypothetical protein